MKNPVKALLEMAGILKKAVVKTDQGLPKDKWGFYIVPPKNEPIVFYAPTNSSVVYGTPGATTYWGSYLPFQVTCTAPYLTTSLVHTNI